jgi:hypothetical protein
MVAWMGAELNKDPIADDEASQRAPVKPEPDRKLEDAVRRAMNDLEQERSAIGEAGRSQPSAS